MPIETVHLSDKQAQRSHFEPSQMVEGGELELRWFCLRVAPKQEHVAIAHLRKVYQVQVFCPRLRFQKATRTALVCGGTRSFISFWEV